MITKRNLQQKEANHENNKKKDGIKKVICDLYIRIYVLFLDFRYERISTKLLKSDNFWTEILCIIISGKSKTFVTREILVKEMILLVLRWKVLIGGEVLKVNKTFLRLSIKMIEVPFLFKILKRLKHKDFSGSRKMNLVE